MASAAARVLGPTRRFLSTESGSAGLLIAASVTALVWANSPWSGTYEALLAAEAGISMADWSLTRVGTSGSTTSDGALLLRHRPGGAARVLCRRAHDPASSGRSGDRRGRRAVVPALFSSPSLRRRRRPRMGRGDRDRHRIPPRRARGDRTRSSPPRLRIFLLTLTVIDDIVAVSVIGLVYSGSLDPAAPWWPWSRWAPTIGLMSRTGVSSARPYLMAGLGLWLATFQAGLHASIAGMLGGLLVRAHHPRPDAIERRHDTSGTFGGRRTSRRACPPTASSCAPCRSTIGSSPGCTRPRARHRAGVRVRERGHRPA